MAFSYRCLIDDAVLKVLKQILNDIKDNGLLGDQSFYISFRTNYEGVVLSSTMKQKYPKEITIVLQHQFKKLNIYDEKFTVNISFGGIAENIEIPFAAITSFLDPVANFGFQFALKKHSDHSQNHHITKADVLPSEIKFAESKKNVTTKEAEVISLDTFREKRDEKKKT